MPNRILKESIWTSPNLNQVSIEAQWLFFRLLPAPDDSGCFEATPLVVKGRCFPLMENITTDMIDAWYSELDSADLIRFWNENGRSYGYLPNWDKHQRIRSVHQRKTPQPPNAVTCRQMSSNDGPNPNPNPNPNLLRVGASAPPLIPNKEDISESAIPKVKQDLKKIMDTLYKENIFLKAPQFMNKMLKDGKNPRAILHAFVRCYTKRPPVNQAWGYCMEVIKDEDGNYNERDSTKAL